MPGDRTGKPSSPRCRWRRPFERTALDCAARVSYDVRMTKDVDISLLLSRWTGGLGRPLTGNYISMPESIELRGSRLVYSRKRTLKRVKPERLLDDFLELADESANNRDILRFARRHGPLYLCESHGIAAYHRPVLMSFSSLGPAPIFGIDEPFKYKWCTPKLECSSPETYS